MENTIPSIFEELADQNPYFEYATTAQRFKNFIIDLVVYCVFSIIILLILAILFTDGKNALVITGWWFVLFTMCNYFTITFLMEGFSKGRSLGKFATGTIVVREDLSPINWKDAFVRSLCRLIPIEPFSGLEGYPWHDSLSKTLVIKKMQSAL